MKEDEIPENLEELTLHEENVNEKGQENKIKKCRILQRKQL